VRIRQLFTVTRTVARSTPTVIERKHCSLATRHSYASFYSSYSTKFFFYFQLQAMLIQQQTMTTWYTRLGRIFSKRCKRLLHL